MFSVNSSNIFYNYIISQTIKSSTRINFLNTLKSPCELIILIISTKFELNFD